ncbi:T-cell-specific surface glycoprotein CD28 [Neophocaena asiaeorientalis asiaeorientalis]|uniref:T-cell-specific surface glycoprotein CD28 n=6 Tax=Odontoceti TaxID=9722 RepID=A0A340X0W1_LIPVE|nr:T-cell-specific surface glycoprotein CD28 [Orcinus orca]XP_004315141.1 T-cell-specific surface glycoprotein CD28 [Tursiops truncatus]XP_007454946.1 PREDICTED: T-cell-specific surface glycoprotein CD28 [Lipotes vexillifer]XP_022423186.1 T-cell-specific surface glycoprotein CD28 [Delphinapterus leucas]XP_024594154.1 T-cell-specific surface glycoprotein CD28 [Neophocaena asiaeorientalis asiaeorientalis]XP_029081575.1 T-cell-specific surface glycoprotein CD28 [Monodon monoceros]XP_032494366.1 
MCPERSKSVVVAADDESGCSGASPAHLTLGLLREEGRKPWPTVSTMILSLLLALNFFPSIQVAENKILVNQSPMLVVNNNEVNLSCKYTYNLFSKEFRASLYKGVDSAVEVCAVNGNHSKSLQSTNKEFNCTVNLGNETVTFYLQDLYVNQTDIYFCKIEVLYPPPYIDNEKSNGTIIHVKEKHLCPAPRSPESSKPFWALVVVNGVLAFYSLLATVALSNCWMKSKRNRMLQSDYMNMTPRRPGPTRKHYQPYAPARDFAAYRS